MSLEYTVRPISDRTWFNPRARETSRFTASWSSTLELLDREYQALDGKNLVIEVDVPERGIRVDGRLRADAKASSPAVVVAFESKHGPLLYRCDRYGELPWNPKMRDLWQHNLRSIALTLESLRAVDRYGATETGQQYAGFKALPAGTAMPASHMTEDEAWSILGSYQTEPISMFRTYGTQVDRERALRAARAANHPDRRGGDRKLWDKVEQAARVLGVSA
jgi:hypothetical protein